MRTAGSSSTTRMPYLPLRHKRHHREIDLEYGALAEGTLHADLAAVIVDDAAHDPKAEPGALLTFRGDEWLEDTLEHFFGDPAARVSDKDPDRIPAKRRRLKLASPDPESAPVRHSIFCV